MPAACTRPIAALPATPPAGATRLQLRGVVCPRCARLVRNELERRGLQVLTVALGGADVVLPPGAALDAATLGVTLDPLGFELLENPQDQLMEQLRAFPESKSRSYRPDR